MARRILMFLLGVALGYFSGFSDAQNHDQIVVVRAVQRVQGVIHNTLGDRAERIERTAEELDDR